MDTGLSALRRPDEGGCAGRPATELLRPRALRGHSSIEDRRASKEVITTGHHGLGRNGRVAATTSVRLAPSGSVARVAAAPICDC